MARLFNVSTDEQERYKLINAIDRVRRLIKDGHYEPVIVYGKKSNWRVVAAETILERYENRLRELDAK